MKIESLIQPSRVPLAAKAVGGPTTVDLVRSLYRLGIVSPEAIADHLGISYHDAMLHLATVKVDMQRSWISPMSCETSSYDVLYRAFIYLRSNNYTMAYICAALRINGLDYFQFWCRHENERKEKL